MQQVEEGKTPREYKLVIHDASKEKPDSWRTVIIDGGCLAFWDGGRWISYNQDIPEIRWAPRWWADFPKI